LLYNCNTNKGEKDREYHKTRVSNQVSGIKYINFTNKTLSSNRFYVNQLRLVYHSRMEYRKPYSVNI